RRWRRSVVPMPQSWSGVAVSMASCLAAEGVADEDDRVGGVVLGRVGEVVIDAWAADGVEDVGGAAAAEGDVAGFAVEVVGAEGEAAVDGHALGLVDRGGVAMGDVAGVEVVG